METQTASLEKSRASVRRWYAHNRDEYAELRRERYRTNPKLRKKARAAAAKYRKDRQAGLIKVRRTLVREVNGMPVEVFTSGYVADRMKYSPQVLRSWEGRGWLPAPIFPGEKHRLYTARQVALIRLLADAVRPKPGRRKSDSPVLDEVINVIHKTWKVVDDAGEKGKKARRSRR